MTEILTSLGKIIEEQNPQRDAIHIAIAPVVANERLAPGHPIGFCPGSQERVYGSLHPDPIGIVDPFLRAPVFEGDRFWMFLYPYTITSLRHEWTHPAFGVESATIARSDREASEAWLRDFVKGADCPGYERVIAAAIEQADKSHFEAEYLHFSGVDAHGEIPPAFWDHIEVVTGVRVPDNNRAAAFSCGC